jgi:hypothetical protein
LERQLQTVDRNVQPVLAWLDPRDSTHAWAGEGRRLTLRSSLRRDRDMERQKSLWRESIADSIILNWKSENFAFGA